MGEEEKQFTVKVAIDKFISVNLTVKTEMSALEFLGLTTKVNQLFKISNKVITDDQPERQKRRNGKWTKEQIDLLKKVYPDTKTSKILQMPEFRDYTSNQICSKAYYLDIKKKAKQ